MGGLAARLAARPMVLGTPCDHEIGGKRGCQRWGMNIQAVSRKPYLVVKARVPRENTRAEDYLVYSALFIAALIRCKAPRLKAASG